MRALVTGGAGFSIPHLVDALIASPGLRSERTYELPGWKAWTGIRHRR
jgi:hypothetical protein